MPVAPILSKYAFGFYAVPDAWKLSDESEGRYALGLFAISSAWRSLGVAKKIYHSVASRFKEPVAKRRREEGAWQNYTNEMGINERHRENRVGWSPVPGIFIRGWMYSRT